MRLAGIPSRDRKRRQTVLEPLGRADPVVVSDVRSSPRGKVVFVTFGDEHAERLETFLEDTVVALLQIPGNRFGSKYVALGDTTDAPATPKRWTTTSRWETDWLQVAPPARGFVGDLSGDFQSLLDEGGTFQTLLDEGGTFLGLLRGDAT